MKLSHGEMVSPTCTVSLVAFHFIWLEQRINKPRDGGNWEISKCILHLCDLCPEAFNLLCCVWLFQVYFAAFGFSGLSLFFDTGMFYLTMHIKDLA